jgi:hypothetical protein
MGVIVAITMTDVEGFIVHTMLATLLLIGFFAFVFNRYVF